jgi:hypothetical protein
VYRINPPTKPQPFGDANEMENPEGADMKPPKNSNILWELLYLEKPALKGEGTSSVVNLTVENTILTFQGKGVNHDYKQNRVFIKANSGRYV